MEMKDDSRVLNHSAACHRKSPHSSALSVAVCHEQKSLSQAHRLVLMAQKVKKYEE
jgi:hypothetical protein